MLMLSWCESKRFGLELEPEPDEPALFPTVEIIIFIIISGFFL